MQLLKLFVDTLMVDRYRATVQLSEVERQRFSLPDSGIDILWIPTDKGPDVWNIICVGSDLYPEQQWQKTAAEIRQEITTTLRGRVLADNIAGPLPEEPQRILKIETFLDHPNMTSQASGAHRELRKAAEAATEVHDVEMTKEQLHQLEKPRSGQNIEDFARKETRKEIIRKAAPDGRIMVEETGKREEVYKMSVGIVDIG